MSDKRIILGSDHGGLELKTALTRNLVEWGWTVEDAGCRAGETVDYPDPALAVAHAVAGGAPALGLLVCGTGIGMCIAANKVPGIRAALCHDTYSAGMARQHNDANVLCLGGRVIGPELARSVLAAFLGASFEGGRHARRLEKIRKIEGGGGAG
jgi:ribose 5-phosphate isomerase B